MDELIGKELTVTATVTDAISAKTMGSGSLDVLATPAMVCLMEKAAADLLQTALTPDNTSVGISMNVQHKAPTPLGMTVKATAKVTAIDGRKVTFAVTAVDDKDEIGSGTHERFIVGAEKFQAKANAKNN